MRPYMLLAILLVASLSGCSTTQVWPDADHIVLGTIEEVSLVDTAGMPVSLKATSADEGVLIKRAIRTTHVIRSALPDFPKVFEQLRDPRKGSATDLAKESALVGEEWVFGLKGTNLYGVCSMHIPGKRITTEKELEEVLKELPLM